MVLAHSKRAAADLSRQFHDRDTIKIYQAVVHGQKSWNGVAILARQPLELI